MNLNVMIANLRRVLKDPILILTIFSLPLIGILILSLMANGGEVTQQISLGVIDLEQSAISEQLIERLRVDKNYAVSVYAESQGQFLFENRRISALVTIPKGFSESLRSETPEELLFSVLKTIPSGMIAGSLQSAVHKVVREEWLRDYSGQEASDPSDAENPIALIMPDKEKGSTNTIVLSIIVLIMMFSTSFFASDIIQLRQKNLLFRFFATPNSPTGITISILGSMLVLYALQALLLFIIGSAFSPVPLIQGNVLGGILLTGCFLLVTLSLGVLVGRICRHPSMISIVSNLIIIPTGMISGTLVPKEFLPAFINKLAVLAPQYWVVNGIEKLNRSEGFLSVIPNALILILFAFCLFSAGIFRFRGMVKV
ncbi:MAG TPA: ABC transporter permease [Thermotogota bacterium]|nr:ABC transporter permease [Thermotogota bacterium]